MVTDTGGIIELLAELGSGPVLVTSAVLMMGPVAPVTVNTRVAVMVPGNKSPTLQLLIILVPLIMLKQVTGAE